MSGSPSDDEPPPPSIASLGLDPAELYNLKVLQGVSLGAVEGLLSGCALRSLAPGEVLIALGQENRTMHMVLSGRLRVHLESPESEPVASLGAGETVGELSVIDARPASAFVVAAEPTRLLSVEESSFWQLVNASHDFAINLLVLFAQRLRSNNSTVSTNIRLQREYKKNAMIDALTGLYNRRWLDEALPRFVRRYGRGIPPLSLLVLDIDHFKRFNDTYGHPAGDAVIVHVAKCIQKHLRPTDLAARFGGEEFVVILPDADISGAFVAAERLREAVKQSAAVGPTGEVLPQVTVSLGAAQLERGQDGTAILSVADAALYQSKRGGRDRVSIGKAS
ncbi:MAG: GGDEF domain-containing protein [Polyangiaceae bacterium]|nr:GGDEF domain-containing protein [Polyangiaceae bacterium]